MKTISATLALVMLASAPLAAGAQQRGGGDRRSAPAMRPAPAAAARPAPAARPAAPARQPGGGFNVGNEFQRPTPPVTRPVPAPINNGGNPRPPGNNGGNPRPPGNGGANPRPPGNGGGNPRPPGNGGGNTRPPGNGGGNTRPPGNGGRPPTRPPGGYPQRPPQPPGGYPRPRPPHTIIQNPGYHGGAWGWNGGTQWNPANGYYGGGFWGGFALAAISAYVYGSIVNAQNQTIYSYQVAPDSPGAQLLQYYQLTQTDCNQDQLVVIYGPQNSLICAYPNATVGPGNYSVDPTTLTLLSQ